MELLEDKKWRDDPGVECPIPGQGSSELHPMKEIILTKEGDTLLDLGGCNFQPSQPLLGDGHIIGQHKHCKGSVRLRRVSADRDAATCSLCGLRLTIPHALQNYGELVQWLRGW